MPMSNTFISRNSDEIDFVSVFVKSIMHETSITSTHELECKIGSDTTTGTIVETDTQVDESVNTAYSNTNNKPTIWFTIDTYFTLKMEHPQTLGSSDYVPTFLCNVYFNNGQRMNNSDMYLYYGNGNTKYNVNTSRLLKYQIVSNANALYIAFTNGVSVASNPPSLFIYKKNSEVIGGPTPQSLINASIAEPGVAQSRLHYINSVDPTAIEIIQSKVVVNQVSNLKIATMDNIWDSTYNSAVMFPVNIGNNQYVYLDNYTIMPI